MEATHLLMSPLAVQCSDEPEPILVFVRRSDGCEGQLLPNLDIMTDCVPFKIGLGQCLWLVLGL